MMSLATKLCSLVTEGGACGWPTAVVRLLMFMCIDCLRQSLVELRRCDGDWPMIGLRARTRRRVVEDTLALKPQSDVWLVK